MEKLQAFEIFSKLASLYPNWKTNKEIASAWIEVLEKEDYENAVRNMNEYIKSNDFPPTIANIIKPNQDLMQERRLARQAQEEEERRAYDEKAVEAPWTRMGISRKEYMSLLGNGGEIH